jgi:hypothetical protein
MRWPIAKKHLVAPIVILVAVILLLLLSGCSGGRSVGVAITPASPVQPGAALSSDIKELTEELKNVRARERLLEGAIDDARTEAVQTKLWLGAGTCFLAALVLVGIGIWTSRRLLIEIGVAAAGLGGLLIFAAWLAPYALIIGITVGVIVIGITVWMLVNRQKGLEQVTRAVDAIKPALPGYKEIFLQHIDTTAEHLIDHVRVTRPKA